MSEFEANETQPCAPYPLFVNFEGERVVVVGGGAVAERKVETLLERGASILVVAPEATDALQGLEGEGRIKWARRPYEPGDLEGALLTVCATDDTAVNKAVHAEARERHQLVNVVDVPALCNVIVPSILRRGRLQIAVSTGGASPSAAREVRCALEEQFPEYWEDYLDAMAELRLLVKQRVPGPMAVRAPLYKAIQESDVLARFEAGERPDAESLYQGIVAPLVKGGER